MGLMKKQTSRHMELKEDSSINTQNLQLSDTEIYVKPYTGKKTSSTNIVGKTK